jgi:fatty-acyl-CoA synthase
MSLTRRAQGVARNVLILARSGLLAPIRPDRLARMVSVLRSEPVTPTTGITLASLRYPDRIALVDERGTLTWAELDQRANALAAGLAAQPGGPPRTVAVLCRNHRGFIEALVAAGKLGATTLLLNTGFAGPQLADVLAREKADLIVHDEEFGGLLQDGGDGAPLRRVVGWTDGDLTGSTVDGLIAEYHGQRPGPPPRSGRIVLLTSGTTGTPKGARLSDDADASTLLFMLDRIPWRSGESVVVVAPMFHAWGFGQLLIAATMSCTIVMRRRFDPEATLALVATHRAAVLGLVPVMLERIVDLPASVRRRYDLRSLRFVTASGSRMRPDAVITFMNEFGDVIYNSYNATEAGLIATATPKDLRTAPDTAGRPVEGTEIRILDGANQEVASGDIGRIFARNNTQFEGYTSGDTKLFHKGFMATGDLGRLDESGRLYVVGRDDEMIVSGGENVYPLEVEDTLAGHDAVLEAAVVGVDDATYGQRLEAFVVLRQDADASPDDLKRHVRENLAGYKVPRAVTMLDELPRGTTGKVLKADLITSARSDADTAD